MTESVSLHITRDEDAGMVTLTLVDEDDREVNIELTNIKPEDDSSDRVLLELVAGLSSKHGDSISTLVDQGIAAGMARLEAEA